MLDTLVKSFIGALIVLLMSFFSKTKLYFIAVILPFSPTFALISHIMIGKISAEKLQKSALLGISFLLPYLFYLVSIYFFSNKIKIYYNVAVSVAVWLVVAISVFLFFRKFL